MATLKDHQQAMVDLLASGSGTPASASRLAHAMHDVLSAILSEPDLMAKAIQESKTIRMAYTTPGLNDKALAADVEVCRKVPTGNGGGSKADLFDRARAAERRVRELTNTVNQLRASNAKLRSELTKLSVYAEHDALPEQAGCRKPDTQECLHLCTGTYDSDGKTLRCDTCGEEMSE